MILLTGGGSLGEAFIKTIKDDLVVVDSNEWTIARLQSSYPQVKFILGDFSTVCLKGIGRVVHTAAYKHLPLGEENPSSFIENNVSKVDTFFRRVHEADIPLLYISTDKAVEPCSLYGYTKAIGEHLANYYGFSVARLGNILNSSGSVIPVWEECIEKGLPIKITDERMTRYFIEDVDAANQLWFEFLKGEKLIIPKCEQIRIVDLLEKVLEKHGMKASEYAPGVEVIGIRPKEKLFEKLKWETE